MYTRLDVEETAVPSPALLPARQQMRRPQCACRARAVLSTPDKKSLLLIRRQYAAGHVIHHLPGGGLERTDASPEDALLRELREEFDAEVILGGLLKIVHYGGSTCLRIYDATARTWSSHLRDCRPGDTLVEVPLTALSGLQLAPAAIASMLHDQAAVRP
ncbi:NUDIX hydrolase [Phytomonospora sp. NPDC050363]|uniref:NUDIX hydrolase n=1 Tax=Phytomonospora sp. NPDC050363 TaxID=3155642 RepID=UPI0033CCCF29